MKNNIKKLPNSDFKVEHKIDDFNGISKQYPKIMKNPERCGFIWESNIASYGVKIKYVED